MLYLSILSTALLYVYFYFSHTVPIGDSLQLAGNQYFFLNEMIKNGVLPKWMPFMTHGTLSNIWYSACASFSFPILFLIGKIFSTNYLILYYLSSLIDELIFLTGMYLLAKKLYQDKVIIVFVCMSAFLTVITSQQIHFNLKFFLLTPLTLYFMILAFEQKALHKLILSLSMVFLSIFGTLPYFLPINLFFFTCSFLILYLKNKSQFLQMMKAPALLPVLISSFFLCLILIVLYLFNTTGINELSFFNVGRDAQGKVSLDSFLSYAGAHSLYKYLELFTGMSINFELQFFSGFLVTFFGLLCFLNYKEIKKALYFKYIFILLIINLLLAQKSILTKLVYLIFPLMSYYRHIAFLNVFLKVFLVLLSGFGLQYYLNHCYKNKKLFKQLLYLSLFCLILLSIDILYILITNSSFLIYKYGRWDLLTVATTILAVPLKTLLSLELFHFVVLLSFVAIFYHNYKKPKYNVSALLCISFVSLLIYKFSFNHFASIQVNSTTAKTFDFYSYPFTNQRTMNYLDNERYQKWHPYLYLPTDTPKFVDFKKEGYSFPGTIIIGKIGALYWSFESLIHLDACMTIYRADHLTKYMREFSDLYGHYQLNSRRMWKPKVVNNDYLKKSGCYYDKIQFFTSNDFSTASKAIKYEVLQFDSNNLKLKLSDTKNSTGYLYYADSWHSFWKAYVNNQETEVIRANKAYKAVKAGTNSLIHFKFENKWLDFAQITYLTICIILFALIVFECILNAKAIVNKPKKIQIK